MIEAQAVNRTKGLILMEGGTVISKVEWMNAEAETASDPHKAVVAIFEHGGLWHTIDLRLFDTVLSH